MIQGMGLLWHDSSGTGFSEKLARAAQKYRQRFGISPTVCYVNAQYAGREGETVAGMRVAVSPTVLLHHLWLSEEGEGGV